MDGYGGGTERLDVVSSMAGRPSLFFCLLLKCRKDGRRVSLRVAYQSPAHESTMRGADGGSSKSSGKRRRRWAWRCDMPYWATPWVGMSGVAAGGRLSAASLGGAARRACCGLLSVLFRRRRKSGGSEMASKNERKKTRRQRRKQKRAADVLCCLCSPVRAS